MRKAVGPPSSVFSVSEYYGTQGVRKFNTGIHSDINVVWSFFKIWNYVNSAYLDYT